MTDFKDYCPRNKWNYCLEYSPQLKVVLQMNRLNCQWEMWSLNTLAVVSSGCFEGFLAIHPQLEIRNRFSSVKRSPVEHNCQPPCTWAWRYCTVRTRPRTGQQLKLSSCSQYQIVWFKSHIFDTLSKSSWNPLAVDCGLRKTTPNVMILCSCCHPASSLTWTPSVCTCLLVTTPLRETPRRQAIWYCDVRFSNMWTALVTSGSVRNHRMLKPHYNVVHRINIFMIAIFRETKQRPPLLNPHFNYISRKIRIECIECARKLDCSCTCEKKRLESQGAIFGY